MQARFGRQPEVIAHRGMHTPVRQEEVSPENTLLAFQKAAENDVAVELDVIALRSGQLVVHHDNKTGRLFRLPSQKQKRVQALLDTDLQSTTFNLDAFEKDVRRRIGDYTAPAHYANLQVPRLETVLDTILRINPNAHIYLETKTWDTDVLGKQNNGLEHRVVELIQRRNLYDQVTILSFAPSSLKKIKRLDPKIKTGWDIHFAITNTWALKRLIPFAKHVLKVDSIHPAYAGTNSSLVRAAHKAGLKIAPYVRRESREQEVRLFPKLTAMGVDGIITNSVDQLKAFLKESAKI